MNYQIDAKGNLILENGTMIAEERRQKAEVYSRCVGYLRPVEQWNDGKQAEFADRKTYIGYTRTSSSTTRKIVA